MLISFYEIESAWQIFLLVLSQVTILTLIGSCVLDFKHRYSTPRRFGMDIILLILNGVLYVLMQISSNVTKKTQVFDLNIPYIVLLGITLLSLGDVVWSILFETKNRNVINSTSIKESFDNLPVGVCFFNEAGLTVLCNREMHTFTFAICGKDVQFISDLKECLSENFKPVSGAAKEGNIFSISSGKTWQLETQIITYENGDFYTQYIAYDITDLQRKRVELTEENTQLKSVQAHLKRLSANVVTITREEEILNTKMRVHDEMGRCLMMAQKYLKTNSEDSISENDVLAWKRAVSMIKYNNESVDEDMLCQIRKTCESVKLNFIQNGTLPKDENVAYILTCAVRECVTNAVYYAGASELYADFIENEDAVMVVVTNNGKQPECEIVEGGGLSTLRCRVERAGGDMEICSIPNFKLMVSIPKIKENIAL